MAIFFSFSMNSQSSGYLKNDVKTHFFHSPSPFPCNFCKCNNKGIFTASQFYVQLPLLNTVWSNVYSEIGLEVTLRPLATSYAKDYKGHSLMQTSFTEPPNSQHALLTAFSASHQALFLPNSMFTPPIIIQHPLNNQFAIHYGMYALLNSLFTSSFLWLECPANSLFNPLILSVTSWWLVQPPL